jgi:hypothetical protein
MKRKPVRLEPQLGNVGLIDEPQDLSDVFV